MFTFKKSMNKSILYPNFPLRKEIKDDFLIPKELF